jgi:hypothetical protein
MVGDIFAGISAFKTALDIARTLKDISDATARNSAVIALQEKILEAQAAQSELVERARELDREISALRSWDDEKKQYRLVALAPNVVAYAHVSDSVPHLLCANCFSNGKKSFLQQHIRGQAYDSYKCNTCREELGIKKGDRPRSALPPGRDRGNPYF